MNQSRQSRHISRVEDNHHMLHVRAIPLDILAKISRNLTVALEQILTSHTLLTRSTARRDDILCARESHLRVNRIRQVSPRESTMTHLIIYTMHTRLINIIQADVRSEAQHQHRLNHVRADHTTSTNDDKLFVR